MKKSKASFIRFGWLGYLAVIILSACAAGAPVSTATPTGENIPYPSYPAYPTNGPSTIYPSPEETLAPDSPVTSPANPPADPSPDASLPYAPQPADAALQRGEVYLEPDQQDVLTLESFPPQFNLALKGELPTPCHQLRVAVEPPNDQNEIAVTAYSVVDPATICTQVLKPFDATIPLRGLPSGTFTVVVNDAPVGEITMP